MNLKKLVFLAGTITLITEGCRNNSDFIRYVDPFIGTDYHGHVFLGANVPFGAVQAGPTNFTRGWDWCSGYHYSDSVMTGFSQTHLSGTGIGDLGDVLITPFTGAIKTSPGTQKDPFSGYSSLYSHEHETAEPGYYSVLLERYGILAEMTATSRVTFHRYTFPGTDEAHIAINLEQGIGWDKSTETYIQRRDSVTYTGYRFSTGWAKDQHLWFAIKLSKPAKKFSLTEDSVLYETESLKGEKVKAILTFSIVAKEAISLKVGISPVSEENALLNINAEIPHWDFDRTAKNARQAWNKELSKIKVMGNDKKDLRIFYTAMYHSFFAPMVFNDTNGEFRGADSKVYTMQGFTNYTVFSLWDTYRAQHPFLTLTQPERVNDMINTMLQIYKQQGKLPVWHLMGNETDCMVGYSAIPVVADAIFKELGNFDKELAFEAMKASSMRDDYGVKLLKEKGYIAADKEKESVSKALEYAVSDWCIAQLAKKLGKTDDYNYYSNRALAYQHYFDPNTGFMRAKLDNGVFREPFNPFKSVHEWGDYTEGNAWQYTWLVPHDVEGLINLFGSQKDFIAKLDSLLIVEGKLGGHASPDISGLIGQYAHGNEPGHHVPYLYAFAGEQWKTAEKVRYILQNLYSDNPDGLCGNEDCGQLSAWYLLSSIGFYQVNPANGCFVFGSPLFKKVSINLPGNRNLTVKTINNHHDNKYIQSVKWNGQEYTRSFITYTDIMKGGKLVFIMGPRPNKDFGAKDTDRPASVIYE